MKLAIKMFYTFTLSVLSMNVYAQERLQIKNLIQFQLDSLQKANGFPGVNFCVILPNQKPIVVASGLSDLELKKPMLTTHRMLSGSQGKTFFAAAALKLASESYFKLDDRIEKFLEDEEWFHRLPNAKTITIRMLLNHTSGLEEYYELGNFMELVRQDPKRTFTPKATIEYLLDRKPLFEAGTSWSYADSNFIVLGYLLEKITGKRLYDVILKDYIKPYQLHFTEPSIKQNLKGLAIGYGRKDSPFPFEGAMVKKGSLVFNPQFEWAGGGFISNVSDLAKWTKCLYNLQEIKPELRKEMLKKVPANTGKNHGYGLGIQIIPNGKLGDSIGHSGWFPGYITDAAYFPDLEMSFAIQFNTDDMSKLKIPPHDYIQHLAKRIIQLTNNKF